MKKYALKLTKYSEAGGPTAEVSFVYADSPQQLSDLYSEYTAKHYMKYDENGVATQGFKMYKVEILIAEYTALSNFDEFCAVNKVLR